MCTAYNKKSFDQYFIVNVCLKNLNFTQKLMCLNENLNGQHTIRQKPPNCGQTSTLRVLMILRPSSQTKLHHFLNVLYSQIQPLLKSKKKEQKKFNTSEFLVWARSWRVFLVPLCAIYRYIGMRLKSSGVGKFFGKKYRMARLEWLKA